MDFGDSFVFQLTILLTSQKMHITKVLEIVEHLNRSLKNCKECVAIMDNVFHNQKSSKILFTVEVLEYFVKNCNRNFHIAANNSDFAKSLLHLLRRQRGKFSLVQKVRSNLQNWTKIEAKVLYLIQLWYDAFILEQASFSHLIGIYKQLRLEGLVFPPRQSNEANLLAIKTESPIFHNISEIAQQDQANFEKKKRALGLSTNLAPNTPVPPTKKYSQPATTTPQFDIQKASQLIMIIRSLDLNSQQTSHQYDVLKNMLQNHKPPPAALRQQYEVVIQEAQKLVVNWETALKKDVLSSEQAYMKKKLEGLNSTHTSPAKKEEPTPQNINILDDDWIPAIPEPAKKQESVNLIDF